MHKLISNALKWLDSNWSEPICGTTDAARVLSVKPNTLRTQVQRGQALALRTPGEVRDTIEFTGYQLVYNCLQQALSRRRYALDGLDEGSCTAVKEWCEVVRSKVLKSPHLGDILIRIVERDDNPVVHIYEDSNLLETTGEPAFLIPIGSMVIRMATDLYVRNNADAISDAMG